MTPRHLIDEPAEYHPAPPFHEATACVNFTCEPQLFPNAVLPEFEGVATIRGTPSSWTYEDIALRCTVRDGLRYSSRDVSLPPDGLGSELRQAIERALTADPDHAADCALALEEAEIAEIEADRERAASWRAA